MSELPEKTIEIYQKEKKFIDPSFIKNQSMCPFTTNQKYYVVKKDRKKE